jgi:hypothetical protein
MMIAVAKRGKKRKKILNFFFKEKNLQTKLGNKEKVFHKTVK